VTNFKQTNKTSNRIILLIIVLIVSSLTQISMGQIWKLRRYEVGAGIGDSQIFGDIGGTFAEDNWFGLRDIQIGETRPAIHLYARYKIDHFFSTKINLIFGNGYGSDETSGLLRQRSYKATFGELSANLEYYFIKELRSYRSYGGYRRIGMLNNYNMVAAYVFAGTGFAYSYSSHDYIEVWETRDDYRPGGNFIPIASIGLGLKYIIDDHWILAGELGYRYTISDYMDGYTQTLNSEFNDVYYVLDISIVYRLKTTRRNIPAILDRKFKQMVQ
jgi:OOP family OmpA-OmpF porin